MKRRRCIRLERFADSGLESLKFVVQFFALDCVEHASECEDCRPYYNRVMRLRRKAGTKQPYLRQKKRIAKKPASRDLIHA